MIVSYEGQSGGEEVIRGLWDKVSEINDAKLKGHQVEIRVLPEAPPKFDQEAFDASRRRIAEMTSGRPVMSKILTAEEIYEDA